MILDNLTRAFKTQNWFAVATEFVIVIAGVVIGFQITEWRADRADRAAEALYLDTLARELDRIRTRLQLGIDNLERYQGFAGRFVEAAEAGDLEAAQQDELVFGTITITRVVSEGLVPASLNELLSSGRLPIIQSADLRNALARLPTEERHFRDTMEQLRLEQSQTAEAVSRRLVIRPSDRSYDFHFNADDSDQELFRQLRYAIFMSVTNRNYLTGYRDQIMDITDRICAEAPAPPACQELPDRAGDPAP